MDIPGDSAAACKKGLGVVMIHAVVWFFAESYRQVGFVVKLSEVVPEWMFVEDRDGKVKVMEAVSRDTSCTSLSGNQGPPVDGEFDGTATMEV